MELTRVTKIDLPLVLPSFFNSITSKTFEYEVPILNFTIPRTQLVTPFSTDKAPNHGPAPPNPGSKSLLYRTLLYRAVPTWVLDNMKNLKLNQTLVVR